MTKIYFVLLVFLILSCNKKEDNVQQQKPESSLIQLNYPSGYGQSGDSVTGTLGFGYDATVGICDTISVRNKVLSLKRQDNVYFNGSSSAGAGSQISGYSYSDLLSTVKNNPYRVVESDVAFLSNMKALLKLGLHSDSIDKSCAYAYYSVWFLQKHYTYDLIGSDTTSEITDSFKNDVNVLTPSEIVKKYGTHVITNAFLGSKFEVLYKCKLANSGFSGDVFNLLYQRMDEYFGGAPGLVMDATTNTNSISNEQLIYNSLGFRKKAFGLINASDNNSNKIAVNISAVMNSEMAPQFITIGPNGLIPLYKLVSNLDKRKALQEFIENAINK